MLSKTIKPNKTKKFKEMKTSNFSLAPLHKSFVIEFSLISNSL